MISNESGDVWKDWVVEPAKVRLRVMSSSVAELEGDVVRKRFLRNESVGEAG